MRSSNQFDRQQNEEEEEEKKCVKSFNRISTTIRFSFHIYSRKHTHTHPPTNRQNLRQSVWIIYRLRYHLIETKEFSSNCWFSSLNNKHSLMSWNYSHAHNSQAAHAAELCWHWVEVILKHTQEDAQICAAHATSGTMHICLYQRCYEWMYCMQTQQTYHENTCCFGPSARARECIHLAGLCVWRSPGIADNLPIQNGDCNWFIYENVSFW